MPNETVHSSGCTNPIQATPHLVIVLVSISNIQKSGTGDNNLQNGKGNFGPTNRNDRIGQVDYPQRWSQMFRSDRTEMVRSI